MNENMDPSKNSPSSSTKFLQAPIKIFQMLTERISATMQKIMVIDRLETFVYVPAITQQPDDSNFEFRPLDSQDFAKMRHRSDRFGEQTRLYHDQRGINSAFGVFIDGDLGHISWAYTAKEYGCEPYERFRLGTGEAEIVNCYTAEAYRGKGLYPYAIRLIAEQLLSRGIKRVFMNIAPDNEASRRGILKAGLISYGQVLHWHSPAIKKWRGWYRQQLD